MVQYCADTDPPENNSLDTFITWLSLNNTVEIIRQVASIYKREQLAELWKKRQDAVVIKKVEAELEKEAESVLEFLVSHNFCFV